VMYLNDVTVSVIYSATGTVTATIGVGTDPYGVAVDPDAGTVYVTNQGDNTVSVIDTATGTVTATIGVGTYPDGVAVDPDAGTVYVANYGDDTVSVINAVTQTVTATIGVGGSPSAVAVDPATHTVYVASRGDDTSVPSGGDGAVSVISATRTPTALTAHISRSPHRSLTLTATLTASGRPLSGQPISFTAGHTHLCTRHTGTRGIATCVLTAAQARQAARHHGVIQATYPGNTTYQPSSATATPST
jgi:YVTN family beta-propeller protein